MAYDDDEERPFWTKHVLSCDDIRQGLYLAVLPSTQP